MLLSSSKGDAGSLEGLELGLFGFRTLVTTVEDGSDRPFLIAVFFFPSGHRCFERSIKFRFIGTLEVKLTTLVLFKVELDIVGRDVHLIRSQATELRWVRVWKGLTTDRVDGKTRVGDLGQECIQKEVCN